MTIRRPVAPAIPVICAMPDHRRSSTCCVTRSFMYRLVARSVSVPCAQASCRAAADEAAPELSASEAADEAATQLLVHEAGGKATTTRVAAAKLLVSRAACVPPPLTAVTNAAVVRLALRLPLRNCR